MSDYDFKSLNDKEFEIFAADILGDLHGVRYERFKPGRDSGVDGRYFSAPRQEVVLQCKHWANTPIDQLIRSLRNSERSKLDQLRPARYVLAVSNPLSRADKRAMTEALSPHIRSESDVFGREDLNDLLKRRPEIERRHYKLWLHSTSVLSHIVHKPIFERSAFSIEESLAFASKYVRTESHDKAIEKLEALRVVIITGEPGAGKTTLAEHLCLHYVARGYEFIQVSEGTHEAEAVFNIEQKQIFYFDDFLGRNYLEALSGREGSKIAQFIRRVNKTKDKRFILTSRSTILNQGKALIDTFRNENLDRNEFEITVESLRGIDKAQILYNHIWHSSLTVELVDEIYKEKRYRKIIEHQNFNPRLISFITDSTRHEDTQPHQYWEYIERALTNPADVWENPFDSQQDDYGRAIVLLTAMNGRAIEEGDLSEAFARFVARPENAGLTGHRDFLFNLRHLSGSLLSRRISLSRSVVTIDLFNPSLGDYVLRRYSNDIPTLRAAFLSLRSVSSLNSLHSLEKDRIISARSYSDIARKILAEGEQKGYAGYSAEYIAKVAVDLIPTFDQSFNATALAPAVRFVVTEPLSWSFQSILEFTEWGISTLCIHAEPALELATAACTKPNSSAEVVALTNLASSLERILGNRADDVVEATRSLVVETLSDSLAQDIRDFDVLADVDYGDYRKAENKVRELVKDLARNFAIPIASSDIEQIMGSISIEEQLDGYYESMGDDSVFDDRVPDIRIDDIDDLFERS